MILNRAKKLNDKDIIKYQKKLLEKAVFKERNDRINKKREILSKSYPKDAKFFWKQIRKTTVNFQAKKPKIQNNIKDTMKIF